MAKQLLRERMLSFLKGDAVAKKQPENIGKGAMYGFAQQGQ